MQDGESDQTRTAKVSRVITFQRPSLTRDWIRPRITPTYGPPTQRRSWL